MLNFPVPYKTREFLPNFAVPSKLRQGFPNFKSAVVKKIKSGIFGLRCVVDHTKIDSDLTHFPVPVRLTSEHSSIFDAVSSGAGSVTAKSVVFDIADNFGAAVAMMVRAIEFSFEGSVLDVGGTVTATYTGSPPYSVDYAIANAFDVTKSKTGAHVTNGYQTNTGNINRRIVIIFDTPQTFDSIIVNNHHNSGTKTAWGFKNVKIIASDDSISDAVYGTTVSNSTVLFDGQFSEHVSSDVEDPEIVYEGEDSGYLKLRVFKSDQVTEMYCEVEQWDSVNQKALLWVSAPDWVISSTEDTEFYISYGETDNTDFVGLAGSTAAQNVWNSDLESRYGFAQDPSGGTGCIKDSTSNANHLTPQGSMTGAQLIDGSIGKAIETDGVDDWFQGAGTTGDFDSPYSVTVNFKLNTAITGDQNDVALFSKEDETNGFGLLWMGDGGKLRWLSNNGNIKTTKNNWAADTFFLLHAVQASASLAEIFIDLTSDASGDNGYNGFDSVEAALGRRSRRGGYADIVFDEVRYYKTDISSAWRKGEYHAQTNGLLTISDASVSTKSTSWTPEEITTALWLDAADSDTLTLDASDNVEQWDDKSGNGLHFTQTISGERPTTTSFNTLTTINFNGEFLNGPSITNGWINSNISIFAVVIPRNLRTASPPYFHTVFIQGTYTSHELMLNIDSRTSQSPVLLVDSDSDRFEGNSQAVNDVPNILSLIGEIDNQVFYINGYQDSTDTIGSIYWNDIIGAKTSLIGSDVSGRSLKGDLAEVIIINDILETEERQKLESYLAHKWGLEDNLPSDHPYKSEAPTTLTPAPVGTFVPWTPEGTTTALWLDAADSDSLTLDASNNVEQWNDKSGNDYHVSQTDSERRPAYSLAGYVEFDGSDDALESSSRLGFAANPDISVIVVAKIFLGSAADQALFSIGEGDYSHQACAGDDGWGWRFSGGNRIFNPVVVNKTELASFVMAEGSTFGESEFFLNGSAGVESSSGSVHLSPTDISNYTSIGNASDGDGDYKKPINCQIYEMIVIPSALAEERQKIEGYLAHKWGLEENLPSDHPYKTEAPT